MNAGPEFQDETDVIMLSGAGTPLNDILTGAPKGSAGSSRFSLLSPEDIRSQQATNGVSDSAQIAADLVQLSDEARNGLEKAYDALKAAAETDAGAKLLRERLAQVQEEIGFIKTLLQAGATGEQAEVLGKQINQLGGSLRQIGAQLGFTDDALAVNSETSVTVEAVSLSYTFNQVAQVEFKDGRKAEISQSYTLQLDYVRITAENTTTAVQAGPGGQKEGQEGSAAAIMSDYYVTKQSFKKLLAEFEKNFTDRDRLPLNLYNTIRNMIEKAVRSSDEKSGVLDKTA